MATTPLAIPIYHDPQSARAGRDSSRKSMASSLSRSTSHLKSPRLPCTPCPKDGDAFSYNPAHLQVWIIPQELWNRLPVEVRSSLAEVQHSGAAVLTGFERLDRQIESNTSSSQEAKVPMEELLVKLEDLPKRNFRTVSDASSAFPSDISSSFTEASSGSQSQSECASPATSFCFAQAVPDSPISLGHPDLFKQCSNSRERSFSTPLEPQDSYIATELSHLFTEAVPRLRHKCMKVDIEWNEVRRTGNFSSDVRNEFENCWAEKKVMVMNLNEKCKRLAHAHGISPTGLGWTAP